MARGWESKAVEAQQEERERQDRPTGPSTAAERAKLAERRVLELSLARAELDLAAATAPAHRQMLQQAIAALREQLDRL